MIMNDEQNNNPPAYQWTNEPWLQWEQKEPLATLEVTPEQLAEIRALLDEARDMHPDQLVMLSGEQQITLLVPYNHNYLGSHCSILALSGGGFHWLTYDMTSPRLAAGTETELSQALFRVQAAAGEFYRARQLANESQDE